MFNKAGFRAAWLLSLMLGLFILLIHVPALVTGQLTIAAWTRPLQDVSLTAAALLLAQTFAGAAEPDSNFFNLLWRAGRFVFALMLIGFGVQQFFNLDFMTARPPAFFPLHFFWLYLTGALMIVTGALIIIGKKSRQAAWLLGVYLLIINLLNYSSLLAGNLHEPLIWTAAMLDLAITAGVFLVALTSPGE